MNPELLRIQHHTRRHFLAHDIVHGVSRKRILVFLGDAVPCKPAWPFVPIDFFEHRSLGFQAIIERARLYRSAGKPVEMRERNFVPKAIIFLGFDDLPFLGGVDAKPPGVVFPHGNIGRAMHHPAGQFPG